MSIRKKLVTCFQKISKIDFSKTEEINGVKVLTVYDVYSKVGQVLQEEEVVALTSIKYDKGEGKVSASIEYFCGDDKEVVLQTIEHPIMDQLWGGGNITLCDKYALILAFKIPAKDDLDVRQVSGHNKNFTKMEAKHTEPVLDTKKEDLSEKTVEEKIKAAATLNNEEVFDGMASKANVPENEFTEKGKEIEEGALNTLINAVVEQEELPPVVEKAEETTKEPEPSQELFKQVNEGGWKEQVPLAKCLDNVTVIKELEKYYTNQGTAIYGHADLKCCPHPIMELINKFSKRRSNLQVRTLLIQWRVGGEKDFWAAAKGQFGFEKDELLAKLNEPEIEEKQEETKPIIALPKLDFKVIDHNGLDRPTEEVLEIHNGLKKAGLTKWTILEALETIPELENVFGSKDTPADTIMSTFLAKANEKQIQLVVQKVQQPA